MTEYDIIIKNGELYDGSGSAVQNCDIAVKNGVIALIAPDIEGTANKVIDARGKIVTPGFVDVHTHYDGQATWDVHLKPSSNLGTTTVVMGNCGVGFAPCREEDHDVLIKLMEGVEEIPGSIMDEGLSWNWESFPEYLDALDERDIDIDVAALFPHAPLRVYVMGERALNREPATADDIQKMQALIREGVAAGAVGFSTSRTLVHRSATGEFIPTYQAASDELKQLGEALSGERGSVFQFISDWVDADDEFSILAETSAKTGAKGTFTLVDVGGALGGQTAGGQAGQWREQLDRLENAQAQGLDIRGQVLSRPIGILMGFPGSMHSFYRRPSFAALDNLDWEARKQALADPALKAKILAEDNENPHVFVEIFNRRFSKMYPLEDPINYLPERSSSVAAIAEREGREPEEWLYDYFLGNDGANLVYIPAVNFTENIPTLLKHPNTVSALGDGGAHVGSICDTSANIYVLTKWVKEKGMIDLAEAVNMLCRQPAELYSLLDRGLLEEGLKADINILDFEALALHTPHVVYDLPAGGKRFLQDADGISATIKAGQIIYENNKATGALPGKLLRGKQDDPRSESS
ncbi:amidohydrolase [Halieaceae bacterium IMCC14734]|uniref:Amidohydrolase n=1 Tax=Candidatus Litorirhabdus singularis TaxID=2518993 RepID=A0ABT3TEL1_9GAMM|nr:amidohydrolase family protein [Candidatus Litorirhabdus singularis]MCX2980753.1 amidohydrolase [Candidatus Litorirhabdus singularis]